MTGRHTNPEQLSAVEPRPWYIPALQWSRLAIVVLGGVLAWTDYRWWRPYRLGPFLVIWALTILDCGLRYRDRRKRTPQSPPATSS